MYVCKKCSYKSNLAASKSFATISETQAVLSLNWLELFPFSTEFSASSSTKIKLKNEFCSDLIDFKLKLG